jgi:hypothetical protein
VLAHAGHWAASLMYFLPVVGLVVFLVVQTMRDRRRGRDEQ